MADILYGESDLIIALANTSAGHGASSCAAGRTGCLGAIQAPFTAHMGIGDRIMVGVMYRYGYKRDPGIAQVGA